MNKKKFATRVVFGSGDKADKILIACKDERFSRKGVTVSICQLKDEYENYGVINGSNSSITERIDGEYVKLVFCKKQSLRAFIELLKEAEKMMTEE